MKRFVVPVLLAVFMLSGFVGVSQTQAEFLTHPILTYVSAVDPADQLPETGLTLYAHVNGANGPAWLVGADSSGLEALAAAGLAFQELEPVLEETDGAAYYLAYTMPGREEVDWAAHGRVLLVEREWRLMRATLPGVAGLSDAGVQLQRLTLDPKPISPSLVPSFPTVIDPDPLVQEMMDQVYSDTVYLYDGNLSGEWPVTIGGDPYTIVTRNTYSGEPIQKATEFVGEHFTDLGLDVEFHQWAGATYPNVIGEITGLTNPDEIYIVSAHLDDMPSSGPAPGADDNASGTVGALIAADIFSQYEWGCTIRFGLWTGEEQGLNGSYAYAQRAYNAGENIAGVLNLDMIGWNTPNSSRDIDLHARASNPGSVELAQLFADVIDAYNVDLIPEINSNGSGASDHASFWNFGYTAIMGIEDFGDFNIYYHSSNDRLANLDLDYFTEFVRASIGSFAHMSDCVIPAGGEPDIDVDPTFVGGAQDANTVTTHSFDIYNLGDETLDWAIIEDGSLSSADDDAGLQQEPSACEVPQDIPWASASPDMGSTAAGAKDTVEVTFDSTGMLAGTYVAALCLESNDPDEPLVVVNLEMIVQTPTDVLLSSFGSETSAILWPALILLMAAAIVMTGVAARKRTR